MIDRQTERERERERDRHAHAHTHPMEYYSAIKRKEIMPFTATQMDLKTIILSKVIHG